LNATPEAVNKVLGEQPVEQKDQLLNEAGTPIKEPTSTGMRVCGGSYGNSAKAKKDQTKSPVDNLKGPKDKEMKEAAKPDFLDMDKDGNKKESMKKAIADKSVKEELKGNQHRIDANNNNKIDGQDFKILRGKKKVKEGREFTEKLLEMVRKSDVPAYLRKAKGDTPLTMADVKAPKKDTISDPKNLAKARNEEVEHIEETKGAQAMKASGVKQSPDKLLARTGMNIAHKFPRKGQTDLGNIPGMNTPGVSKDTADYAEKRRGDREKQLKPAIKSALGTHGPKGKLPEEVEHIEEKEAYEPSNDAITTDTLAGRMPGGKFNSFKSFKTRVSPLSKESGQKPGDDTPEIIQPQDTPARKSHEVKEATIAGLSGFKRIKKDVADKSGAVHTPMSRARDLAQQALKTVQNKTKVK
jgi:hypothetical protein